MGPSMGEGSSLLLSGDSRTSPVTANRFRGIQAAIFANFVGAVANLIIKTFQVYNPFAVTGWRFQGMIILSIPVILVHACLPTTKEMGYAKTFGIGPGLHTLKGNLKIISLIVVSTFMTFCYKLANIKTREISILSSVHLNY